MALISWPSIKVKRAALPAACRERRRRRGNEKRVGESLLLAALAAVPLDDATEWFWFEVKVTLDCQASRSSRALQFGEHKIAPLVFVAADVTEEAEVILFLFAFGDKPGPV